MINSNSFDEIHSSYRELAKTRSATNKENTNGLGELLRFTPKFDPNTGLRAYESQCTIGTKAVCENGNVYYFPTHTSRSCSYGGITLITNKAEFKRYIPKLYDDDGNLVNANSIVTSNRRLANMLTYNGKLYAYDNWRPSLTFTEYPVFITPGDNVITNLPIVAYIKSTNKTISNKIKDHIRLLKLDRVIKEDIMVQELVEYLNQYSKQSSIYKVVDDDSNLDITDIDKFFSNPLVRLAYDNNSLLSTLLKMNSINSNIAYLIKHRMYLLIKKFNYYTKQNRKETVFKYLTMEK